MGEGTCGMKFEQAFYTWGKNQLSRYKVGLGVCASSSLEPQFLDGCLQLGASFTAEQSFCTAEFVVYSPAFHTFVGVGVSPREEAGDGRLNKLCHFFIPENRDKGKEPEKYLLPYPFKSKIGDREEVGPEYLEEGRYDYGSILRDYGFSQEKRMAMVLWKVYQCVFQRTSRVVFVIGGQRPAQKDLSTTAREITWMLAWLVPVPKDDPDRYRIRLAYGVHTDQNVSAVNLVFTDRGEKVVYGDIKREISRIVAQAEHSAWYRELLYDYLVQAEDIDNEGLVQLWVRAVLPWLSAPGSMDQDRLCLLVGNILQMMFQANRKNYGKFLMDIPRPDKDKILRIMCEKEKQCIFDDIGMAEGAGPFLECFDRYGVLMDQEKVARLFWERADSLYETSDPEGKGKIAERMRRMDRIRWEDCLKTKVMACQEPSSFASAVLAQKEQMAPGHTPGYYERLLEMCEKASPEDRESLEEAERVLWELGKELVDCQGKEKFRGWKKRWEMAEQQKRIHTAGLRELADMDLGDLADMDLHEQGAAGLVQIWLQRASGLESADRENLSRGAYLKLAGKIPWLEQELGYCDFVEQFERGLWEASVGHLEWRMGFCYYKLDKRKEIDSYNFWEKVSFGDFKEIYRLTMEHGDWSKVIDAVGSWNLVRRCYLYWRDVNDKKAVYPLLIRNLIRTEEERRLVKNLQDSIPSMDREPVPVDIVNFLRFQNTLDTGQGQCRQEYREIKGNRAFVEVAVRQKDLEKQYPDVKEKWEDMRWFFHISMLAEQGVRSDNLCDVRDLLERSRGAYSEEWEYQKLERQMAEEAGSVEKYNKRCVEFENYVKEIKSRQEEINGYIQEIGKAWERVETGLDTIEECRKKIQRCKEEAQELEGRFKGMLEELKAREDVIDRGIRPNMGAGPGQAPDSRTARAGGAEEDKRRGQESQESQKRKTPFEGLINMQRYN